jgi:hypothetical protein
VDGRIVVVGLAIVLPGVLMGATVVWFSTNPLAMLGLFATMLLGGLYLLSYSDTFSGYSPPA